MPRYRCNGWVRAAKGNPSHRCENTGRHKSADGHYYCLLHLPEAAIERATGKRPKLGNPNIVAHGHAYRKQMQRDKAAGLPVPEPSSAERRKWGRKGGLARAAKARERAAKEQQKLLKDVAPLATDPVAVALDPTPTPTPRRMRANGPKAKAVTVPTPETTHPAVVLVRQIAMDSGWRFGKAAEWRAKAREIAASL